MTHEEFAHICLSIKKGNTDIPIPCCANCMYYGKKQHKYVEPDQDWYYCNVFDYCTNSEDFCSKFKQRKD